MISDESERIRFFIGIDFDLDYNFVIFDGESYKVKVLDSVGRLIRNMSSKIEFGSRVEGILVDIEGRIIIIDVLNGRVLVFYYSGYLCFEFGVSGKNKLERLSFAVFY